MKAKRKSFKWSRIQGRNIKKGKMSAAYWVQIKSKTVGKDMDDLKTMADGSAVTVGTGTFMTRM